ncbi:hypothetical protein BKA58DRAFT_424952 [Alternaria rosae]|uniref:uncharacterized protein n=1 Tax=Alternaria rosae TaxID=1187941 RepID=UPI001E8EAE24|nr:uncharacterized protein BKA58DRAFT_424952 [Alternaria rosae]KAH6851395.1 hypothetical protein BKA58DRAFT_424952 [Alternaria rosae]
MGTNSNFSSIQVLRRCADRISIDTVSHNTASSSGWTKEAIFTLLSVFLTITLAIIGFILRHYVQKRTPGYRRSNGGRRTEPDEELHIDRSPQRPCWVDLAEARRYQQQAYTSVSRLRRGPRP